jgi:PAS domain S-box-containing protein
MQAGDEPQQPLTSSNRPRVAGSLLTMLIVAAIALPLAIVGVIGWLGWRYAWQDAESELARTADGASEYAWRVLGSHVLAAELVNEILHDLTDDEIRAREQELHEKLRRLVPSVPMANTIALSDRNAVMLLTANVVPVPRVSIEDREWVQALRRPDPPPVHVSSVTTGRVDTNFFFGISVRRTETGNGLPEGAFDGVINVSVNPDRLATGFRAITQRPEDVISLIRRDGELLTRIPEFSSRLPPLPPNSPFFAATGEDRTRGIYAGSTIGSGPDWPEGQPLLIAFRQVGDLPVYVTVSRLRSAVVARWQKALLTLLTVGLVATGALVVLGSMVRRRHRRLSESEHRLHTLVHSLPIGVNVMDSDGRTMLANPAFRRFVPNDIIPSRSTTGEQQWIANDDEGRRLTRDRFPGARALRGETVIGTEFLYRESEGEETWTRVSSVPLWEPGGRLVGALAVIVDIDVEKRAQERLKLLAREVDHRSKNMLAVVQALLHISRADTLNEFRDTVRGRVAALARAHTLLSQSRWEGAEFKRLVEEELAPYRKDQGPGVRIEGPALSLAPAAAQSLAMTLHELATNAAKYGAFSVRDGRVSVEWRIDAAGEFSLRWTEEGGPPVIAPEHEGVGISVIGRAVRDQLSGTARFNWDRQGLTCEITLRADQLIRAQRAA